MDHRLQNISKAVAQSAINTYSNYAVFRNIHHNGANEVVRKVYNELVIGVKCKVNVWKLAKLVTTSAIIAYQQNKNPYFSSIQSNALFIRAHTAVHATLKKMIRETNHQRRLQ
jgi:hypothetical protein